MAFVVAHQTLLTVLSTIAVAWFTGTLWRATSGLQRIAAEQARDMADSLRISSESARAAEKAANAADLSAKASIGIELPVLRAPPAELLRINRPIPGNAPYSASSIDEQPSRYSTVNEIVFKNYGRTPAFPTKFEAGWKVTARLPEIPTYNEIASISHAAVIRPERDFMLDFHPTIELTDEDIAATMSGESCLWLLWTSHLR